MTTMTQDSINAPWNDDYQYVQCPDCLGDKYIFGTNSVKRCKRCQGEGEIKEY
jgi:ribosomal protein S27E